MLVSATRGQIFRSLLWFALALLVHPTNLFLLPIWFIVLLNTWMTASPVRLLRFAKHETSNNGEFHRPSSSRAPMVAILLALCSTALCWLVAWLMRGRLAEIVSKVGSRAVDGAEGLDFLGKLVELHSGSTIYRFIVGEIPASYALGRDGVTAIIWRCC